MSAGNRPAGTLVPSLHAGSLLSFIAPAAVQALSSPSPSRERFSHHKHGLKEVTNSQPLPQPVECRREKCWAGLALTTGRHDPQSLRAGKPAEAHINHFGLLGGFIPDHHPLNDNFCPLKPGCSVR